MECLVWAELADTKLLKFDLRDTTLSSAILEGVWLRQVVLVPKELVAGHVLRVSGQLVVLLLGHLSLDGLRKLDKLLRMSRFWDVDVVSGSWFGSFTGPHLLVVEANVLVELLLDLSDLILKPGQRSRRFLIWSSRQVVKLIL